MDPAEYLPPKLEAREEKVRRVSNRTTAEKISNLVSRANYSMNIYLNQRERETNAKNINETPDYTGTNKGVRNQIQHLYNTNFERGLTKEELKALRAFERELLLKPGIRYEKLRKRYNEFLDNYRTALGREFQTVLFAPELSPEQEKATAFVKRLQIIRDTVYPRLQELLDLPAVAAWPLLPLDERPFVPGRAVSPHLPAGAGAGVGAGNNEEGGAAPYPATPRGAVALNVAGSGAAAAPRKSRKNRRNLRKSRRRA